MKTCRTLLAVPYSTKLGHHGQTTRELIGECCSIVKLVFNSTSLLALFVAYSVEGGTHYCGENGALMLAQHLTVRLPLLICFHLFCWPFLSTFILPLPFLRISSFHF